MNAKQSVYLTQGIDYLGFLNAKLRDLRGWATLLNELVQNADDPEDASRITLDVTDEALVVENDGLFTDCGAITESRCGFDTVGDGRKICDFHAFRRVASGHKRLEEDTTGAFGIGFISVYQITDQPSLRSGKWFWLLRPEEEEGRRIEASEQQVFPGTRFDLPWAKTPTALRTSLGMEPVPSDVVDRMCAELRDALSLAAPFLKRLRVLELRRNGKEEFVVRCERDAKADQILVDAGGQTRIWTRLSADFAVEAEALRTRYGGSIESKRKTEVTVAVPMDGLTGEGRLYATLPTEHEIGLPVLINADFFPSSDRKRILFDRDYQGEWNRSAIRAAAHAIGGALPALRDSLKPVDLWEFFKAAKSLQRLARDGKTENVFGNFWEAIAPLLRSDAFVFTSRKRWCAPKTVRLLQSARDEAPILPLLEALDQNVVHLDLQPFSTELREQDIGVGYLTLDDLSSAMAAGGLNRTMSLAEAPVWLRTADNRRQLGLVIERLLERVAKDAKAGATERIRNCSLVMTVDGMLSPPSQLRTADAATRRIFEPLQLKGYWAADDNPAELLQLASPFSLQDAINLLRKAGTERLEEISSGNEAWVKTAIAWLAENRSQITQSLQNELRALPIWPSGGKLCPLNGLSVPGDFNDPLKLARIVDPEISRRFRSFLTEDLCAQQLTLRTYLCEHVPRAFESDSLPSAETRRQLMRLLVEHAGILVDDAPVATVLRQLPIVECDDGEFRKPTTTYFDSEVVRVVLGKTVARAKLPEAAQKASRDLLAWLGVHEWPQPDDVLNYVSLLAASESTEATREMLRGIFKGLADHWEAMSSQHEELAELRNIRWLPGERSAKLHMPKEVFAVFQKHLFYSQAVFLDIPHSTQQKGTKLLESLGVQDKPSVLHVVKHLLHVAKHGGELNLQVYEVLNRNTASPAIDLLVGEKCLALDDSSYADPGKVFWDQHPFGNYRVRLSAAWRSYQTLMDKLGVAAAPGPEHAVRVLTEIATKYADNRVLAEEDQTVVTDCWNFLSRFDGDEQAELLSGLAKWKVVPNSNHFLRYPRDIFFADRPGLAEKFGATLKPYAIPRPEAAWRAMALAGVRPLSAAVQVELVECADPCVDQAASQKLSERWSLVRRVFATVKDAPVQIDVTSPPAVWVSDRLVIVHRMETLHGEPEEVTVHLTKERDRLYYLRDRTNIQGAIARELAFGYFPDAAAGPLAAAIKEVLLALDTHDASAGLDDLGIPEIEFATDAAESATESGVGASATDGEGTFAGTGGEVGTEGGGDHLGAGESTTTKGEGTTDGTKTGSRGSDGTDKPQPDTRGGGAGGKGGSSGDGDTTKHKPKIKTDRPMLRSYMSQVDANGEEHLSPEAKARRDETDRKGVAIALAYETQAGRYPTGMKHFNKGYDIESRNEAGEIVRYIEVKSISSAWDGYGVGLSAPQFDMAQKERERSWLYVVDGVAGDNPGLTRIQDPATKIVDYRFDDGWRIISEPEGAPRPRSLRDVIKARRDNPESAGVHSEQDEP